MTTPPPYTPEYVEALENSYRTSQSIFAALHRRSDAVRVVVTAADDATAEAQLAELRSALTAHSPEV